MQIKHYQQKLQDFGQRLSDIRFVGQVIFVILVLLISWSGVKSIQANYELQKQISSLNQQNSVTQLQNNNLSLQNQYYNSDQYLELSARQNFGLAAPGEKEIVVPASVALQYTVAPPNFGSATTANDKQPAYQRHLQSWIDFFLHRQPAND